MREPDPKRIEPRSGEGYIVVGHPYKVIRLSVDGRLRNLAKGNVVEVDGILYWRMKAKRGETPQAVITHREYDTSGYYGEVQGDYVLKISEEAPGEGGPVVKQYAYRPIKGLEE